MIHAWSVLITAQSYATPKVDPLSSPGGDLGWISVGGMAYSRGRWCLSNRVGAPIVSAESPSLDLSALSLASHRSRSKVETNEEERSHWSPAVRSRAWPSDHFSLLLSGSEG